MRRALLLTLLVAALAVCARQPPAPGAAERVVSVSPNTTEAMYAIGAGELLVGRSQHCDFPPEARRLPSVGGFAAPSVEAIVALRPTLVVGDRGPAGPELVQKLGAHGIAAYFPAAERIEDIEALIVGLGRRVGHAAEAERVAAQIRSELGAIAHALGGRPPVSVVMVFDPSPIVVAGPGGFPDELIRRAGARNVVDRGGAFPTVSIERLLVLDPDVVIDASDAVRAPGSAERTAPSPLASAPGWRELRAAREGRVRRLAADAVLRPGPRIAEGLAAVVRALHPGALEDRKGRP
ncbi:MAG: ABC transporter substrate-binding protein [Deltaproteobacteria bacterium]|nr:ABC transporter substrate-binding protein [Deltaproteobacteria bacterium]